MATAVEYVKCNKCGCVYEDKESVELVKQWLATDDKYAPCPNIGCKGQMELLIDKGG